MGIKCSLDAMRIRLRVETGAMDIRLYDAV